MVRRKQSDLFIQPPYWTTATHCFTLRMATAFCSLLSFSSFLILYGHYGVDVPKGSKLCPYLSWTYWRRLWHSNKYTTLNIRYLLKIHVSNLLYQVQLAVYIVLVRHVACFFKILQNCKMCYFCRFRYKALHLHVVMNQNVCFTKKW